MEAFVQFYLENAGKLAAEVGYIPLPQKMYKEVQERFSKRVTGTAFGKSKSKS